MFVAVSSATCEADSFALRFENAIIGLRIPCLAENFTCEIGLAFGAGSRDLDLMRISEIGRLFGAGDRDLDICQIRHGGIESPGIDHAKMIYRLPKKSMLLLAKSICMYVCTGHNKNTLQTKTTKLLMKK